MVDPIYFNNAQASASMQQANYKHEEAKASSFEQALNAAAENNDDEKIMEAAREFESYFLNMMLKEMRNTIPKGELIPRNNAEQIFQDMLDEEYSKNAAQGAGIGLAQMIFEQMTRNNQAPPEMTGRIILEQNTPADDDAEANAPENSVSAVDEVGNE